MLPQPHHDRLSHAYALIDLRRFDQALAEVQHVLALDPHSVEAHICAAAAWRSQDRFPEAEHAARTALAFQPDYPPACYILALILWDQDRFAEAEPPFRQAVRDPHPLQPIYLIQFARRLASIRRLE
jgi:Tfp pilus assembly protein PilF